MRNRLQVRKVIGQQIADLRKIRRMSQGDLAEKMGIDRNRLSRIERGHSPIDISELPEFAIALDVKIETITSVLEPLHPTKAPHFGKIQRWKNRLIIALEDVHTENDQKMFTGVINILANDPPNSD